MDLKGRTFRCAGKSCCFLSSLKPVLQAAERVREACRRLKPTPSDENKRLGCEPEGPHYPNLAPSAASSVRANDNWHLPVPTSSRLPPVPRTLPASRPTPQTR